MLCLKVAPANHDTALVLHYNNTLKQLKNNVVNANYYKTCVHIRMRYTFNCSGCPIMHRADYGTENASLAKGHVALRMHHTDHLHGDKSFIYGPSTANVVT